jgi:hypothetical protein
VRTLRYRHADDTRASLLLPAALLHRGHVSLAEQFAAAVAAETDRGDDGRDDGGLLPDRLARAVARLLDVAGAGLSVLVEDAGHLPIGASSADAARAERLQFTAGAGPCLLAHATGRPAFVLEQDIRSRWPPFADLLLTSTPFHAIVSLPLEGVGAMDLFFRDPADVPRLDVFAAMAVGDLVVGMLGVSPWSTPTEAGGSDWRDSPPALRRAAVWRAVGETGVALDVDAPDALALLRGYAYAAGRSVDSVAADVLSGRLRPADVAGGRIED